jgi:hypothetical protein
MKVSNTYPPNYDSILAVFPNLKAHKPIFCYGDTIFNPFNAEITPDLEAHEEVHSKQQGHDPHLWWGRYLTDKEFRLSQEIEAYGTQYALISKLVDDRKLVEWFKEKTAQALSGELYGNLLTYGQAVSKIRNYAKKVTF